MRRALTWALPALVLLVCMPLAMAAFARTVGPRAEEESLELVAQSVRRAAVQCYALEGAYPTGVDYLEEHYGVSVNPDRFRVDYIYIGSNLMPDITVIPLGDGA